MRHFVLAVVLLAQPCSALAASLADDSSLFARASKQSCARLALEFDHTTRYTNPQGQVVSLLVEKEVILTGTKATKTSKTEGGRARTESVAFTAAVGRDTAESLVRIAASPIQRDLIISLLGFDHPHNLIVTLNAGSGVPRVELYAGDNFQMDPALIRARCVK